MTPFHGGLEKIVVHTCKDEKRSQATILAKQDVSVQPVSHHNCPFRVEIYSELSRRINNTRKNPD